MMVRILSVLAAVYLLHGCAQMPVCPQITISLCPVEAPK